MSSVFCADGPRMPGTKIVINSGEADPDPAPYLFVSAEIKQKIAEKK
jgi:hypothetical protein